MAGIGDYDKKEKGSRGYKMKGHELPGIKQRPVVTSSEKLQNLAKDYDNRKDMPGYKEALLKAAETVGIENLPKRSPVKQDKKKKKAQTTFEVGGREVDFTDKQGNPISPAGSSIRGDVQKIYSDRSKEGLSSSDTLYYNQKSGSMGYYDPESKQKQGILGFEKGKPYSGTKKIK